MLKLPAYESMPWRTNADAGVGRSIFICPGNPRRSTGTNLFHYCLNGFYNGTGDAQMKDNHFDLQPIQPGVPF